MASALYRTMRRQAAACMRYLDQRWVHYLLIALLMSCLASLLGPNLRVAVQFDSLVEDQYLNFRGAKSPAAVAQTLPETRDILVVSAEHDLPRTVLARLVTCLKPARAVFLDFMLVDRENQLVEDERPWYTADIRRWQAEDRVLAAAIHDADNVVLGAWVRGESGLPFLRRGPAARRSRWSYPPQSIWASARHRGHLGVVADPSDQVIRRVQVMENVDGEMLPCVGLAAAAALRGVAVPGTLAASGANSSFLFGRARIPVDTDGTMRIDYVGGPACFSQESNRLAYQVVLDGYLEPQDIANKVIVVGETSEQSNDTMPTPFGHVPGLMVHCNVIATLLSDNGPPVVASRAVGFGIGLLASVLLVALLLRLPLWFGVPLWVAESLLVLVGGAWALRAMHVLTTASVPMLAMGLTYNAAALYEFRRARQTIGLFAGQHMVPRALPIFSRLSLGGREEDACAFFCDIRGYSELAQHLAPRDLGRLTNEYTDALEAIVEKHRGCTINYQGDGVFVLFEPLAGGEHYAIRAAHAALDLQQVFGELSRKWAAEHARDVRLGIGISAGRMLVGVMGARRRMQFSAVGDAVNIAARIQGLSDACGCPILVTRATRDLLAGAFEIAPCGNHMLRGQERPVEVYGVLRARPAADLANGGTPCADTTSAVA